MPKKSRNNRRKGKSEAPQTREQLDAEWTHLLDNVAAHVQLVSNEVNTHGECVAYFMNNKKPATPVIDMQETIKPAERMLGKILGIEKKLNAFYEKIRKKLQENLLVNRIADKQMLNQIKRTKTSLLTAQIQLRKTIADKYNFQAEHSSSIKKKKECLEHSHQNITTAWQLTEAAIKSNLLSRDYDPSVKMLFDYISERHAAYHQDPAKQDEIERLLFAARQTMNKAEAAAKFQEALVLAKEKNAHEKQFLILDEQALHCATEPDDLHRFLNLKEIQAFQKNIQDTLSIRIEAIQIKIAMPHTSLQVLKKCELICEASYRTAIFLIEFAMYKIKDMDKIKESDLMIAFLNDAITCLTWGQKLASSIGKSCQYCQRYETLSKQISSEIQGIEKHKEKIQQIRISKQEQALTIERRQEEYDEEFDKTINTIFPNDEITIKIKPSPVSEEEPAQEEESSEEEYIETFASLPASITIDEYLRALEVAKTENDALQQVHLLADIADYYRLFALNLIKRNKELLLGGIQNLEWAITYFQEAIQIIKTVKMNTHLEAALPFIDREEGLLIVLQDTEKRLDKIISHQERVQQRLYRTRFDAMQDVIRKNGGDRTAWFKEGKFELSETARKLLNANKSLPRLYELEKDVQEMKDALAGSNPIPKQVEVKDMPIDLSAPSVKEEKVTLSNRSFTLFRCNHKLKRSCSRDSFPSHDAMWNFVKQRALHGRK